MSMFPDVQPVAPSPAAGGGPPPTHPSRWDRTKAWWREAAQYRFFVPLLLVILAFSLYLPRLAEPDKYLFDEILFAYTAGQYAEGNPDSYQWDHPCSVTRNKERCVELYPEIMQGNRVGRYQWAHPPLGKLFMAGGILIFGNDPFGWRIMSAVAGASGIVIAYFLGMMVTGRRAVGILTAGFLLFENIYFVYSRMGLVDIFLTVLTMATLLAFTWYLKTPIHRARIPLLVTGLLMSMSIATKWSAAYGGFFIGLVIIWRFFMLWRDSRKGETTPEMRRALREHLILGPVALVILPIAVYLLAYLPYFIGGHNNFGDFVELQRAILRLQTNLNDSPRTASRWWTWPLDWRSVWFGTRTYSDGRIARTYALGNPILYWAFLPAVTWTLVRWWRSAPRPNIAIIVLLIGFFGQWLPWMFVSRSMYLYHFLPSVPFGCLAVAATVVYLYENHRDWRRTLAVEYAVLVVLVFAFFYPILSYYPISERAMWLRMWLASWV